HEQPPKVIFLQLCDDLRPQVDAIPDCKLPVALQAFSATVEGFPAEWAPLSVVAPLTEFSAEYQAIAFALQNPETDLVFVDRSVDHVFQWLPEEEASESDDGGESEDEDDDVVLHGAAVGVELGSMVPSFTEFLDFLLRNARVSHFAEWWSLYVEQPTVGAEYATYRQV
ncbi:MAG: hypothetical protein GY849_22150, partial [Deltaproteobacteria bacterium]|nr:hypothetical protein [Deltaproteobacteria bacterium]